MSAKRFSSRSVDVRSTHRCPMTGRTLVPRSWRALARVFGDFVRAWRDVLVGATFGQPSANHASITSLNVALRIRRGPGSSDCARRASSSSRSRWASAFSTRSTLRREPSRNRTHAIHRPAASFQRTVGRCATARTSHVASSRKATSNWLRRASHPGSEGPACPLTWGFRWRRPDSNRRPPACKAGALAN